MIHTLKIPSSRNDYFHTITVWPDTKYASCGSIHECGAARAGKPCHACKKALEMVLAPKPEPPTFLEQCEIERQEIRKFRDAAIELGKNPGAEVSAAFQVAGANRLERELDAKIASHIEAESVRIESDPDHEFGPFEDDYSPEQTAPSFPLQPAPIGTSYDLAIHDASDPFAETVHPAQKCGTAYQECLESAPPILRDVKWFERALSGSLLLESGGVL